MLYVALLQEAAPLLLAFLDGSGREFSGLSHVLIREQPPDLAGMGTADHADFGPTHNFYLGPGVEDDQMAARAHFFQTLGRLLHFRLRTAGVQKPAALVEIGLTVSGQGFAGQFHALLTILSAGHTKSDQEQDGQRCGAIN